MQVDLFLFDEYEKGWRLVVSSPSKSFKLEKKGLQEDDAKELLSFISILLMWLGWFCVSSSAEDMSFVHKVFKRKFLGIF